MGAIEMNGGDERTPSVNGEPAVLLNQVSKTYQDGGLNGREVVVLRQINLCVENGETLAIVGPSGSGKSTLLNLLGALDLPDQGTVEVLGHDLARMTDRELAELRNAEIGFVFQFHQLLPDFTILENVAMPGRIAGRPLSEVNQRAKELLREVDLDHRFDFFPSELSGGERQRVAICRALINDPSLLLADEPTGNLDAASGSAILEIFLALRKSRKMSAVIVTHNMEVARRCERIVSLDLGKIAALS